MLLTYMITVGGLGVGPLDMRKLIYKARLPLLDSRRGSITLLFEVF